MGKNEEKLREKN